ncbi:MAG: C45 family peptidase [Patescibacteria group bacterium]|nr:C45 family peptidase [Patescibacteria group bacterium]
MKKIPFIKVYAKNHEDFGYQLGKALSKKIASRIKANKIAYKKRGAKDFDILIKDAKKFLPAIKKEFPNLLKELKCMSKGAGVSFDELLVLNCEEEILDYYIPHCTSIAVHTGDGQILIGHNDDWMEEYWTNGTYLVEAHINSHSFLALSYMGSLPGTACGINNRGVCFTVNSLDYKRFRLGIPRIFLLRQLLEARDIKEARRLIKDPWASICANTLLAEDETIEDIETLWCHHEVFHSNKWLIHTNHPLEHKYQNRENTPKESVKRYEYANKTLSATPKINIDILKKILKDHKSGICSHKGKHSNSNFTIASAIMNPEEKWMMVCHGAPCKNRYTKYYL